MASLTPYHFLEKSQTIVIKIGSSLLMADDNHIGKDGRSIRKDWLDAIGEDIEALKAKRNILIVSSGAIALGRQYLKLKGKLKLEESQAAAAAGQVHLIELWQSALKKTKIAQILLTAEDTQKRRSYLNARNTLTHLLALGVIPIINENDTIATNEIRYGDNDQLAACLANMIGADCLILLSTVDGLLSQDPAQATAQGKGHLIDTISAITPDIEAKAGDRGSDLNRGGMKAKLAAAKIAWQGGCHMMIANGLKPHPLKSLWDGGACSWFRAPHSPKKARQIWIAGGLKPKGSIYIDDGAIKALEKGKSLLPIGVKKIEGRFTRGEPISIKAAKSKTAKNGGQREIARGLSAYSHKDASKIAGHKSDAIEALLGYHGRVAMVHRDDLVLLSLDDGFNHD